MRLIHDIGSSISLHLPGQEAPRFRYVYGGKPKPFFHPLCSPSGHVLSMFEPHDHVWHRGLWFTIKFINRENFWEEKGDDGIGTQRLAGPLAIEQTDRSSLRVSCAQEWVRPNGETIIDEQRAWSYRELADDAYAIDFRTTLTPRADVLLDRTPFTTWGGYGGLIFRGTRNWQESVLSFDDGSTSNRPTPIRSKWCDLSGKLDGGPKLSAGVAIFDHPTNPRHPAPWYGATGPGHYFNAAFLFLEPMALPARQPLAFNYRVLVHEAMGTSQGLSAEYEKWIAAPV